MSETCNDSSGCDKPVFARGKCSAHYQQERRHGETQGPVRQYGRGYNRISGGVNDVHHRALKDYARDQHGGSIYKAVQYIITLFLDGR